MFLPTGLQRMQDLNPLQSTYGHGIFPVWALPGLWVKEAGCDSDREGDGHWILFRRAHAGHSEEPWTLPSRGVSLLGSRSPLHGMEGA